jgi:hypothetical protein
MQIVSDQCTYVATPTWLAKPQLVLDSKQTGTTTRMPRIQKQQPFTELITAVPLPYVNS